MGCGDDSKEPNGEDAAVDTRDATPPNDAHTPDDARVPDGGSAADGSAPAGPELRLGTGCLGQYAPITDGDTLRMERGPQGAQHVWLSLRARNMNTSRALVQLRGRDPADTEDLAFPADLFLTFTESGPDGFDQLSGLRLIIKDGDGAAGQPLLIRATVSEQEPGSISLEEERLVHIEWATTSPCILDGGTDAGAPDAGATPDAG
jgi:hypothetical protein